jgi:hypothetical protein
MLLKQAVTDTVSPTQSGGVTKTVVYVIVVADTVGGGDPDGPSAPATVTPGVLTVAMTLTIGRSEGYVWVKPNS